MLHFSNQELAELHHVSVRTVRNWIDSARDGKLDLALQEVGQRHYIANTSKNQVIIGGLAQKNKKYRPHRAQKILAPRPEFYDYYSQEQIYDIVSNIEIHHEIPQQYNYFQDGAVAWDEFAQHMSREDSINSLTATIDLLKANRSYLEYMLSTYDKINVIDIGVGNALPIKDYLESLLKSGKLGRYVAIDISSDMLKIAKQNISDWFAGAVDMECIQLDITQERFTELLAREYTKKDWKNTANLLVVFGGTIGNLRSPSSALRNIYDSMGLNDFLLYAKKLDTAATRRFFDFNTTPGDTVLAPVMGFVVNQLNIDKSMYDLDVGYNAEQRQRFERIILKIAITINFKFDGGERSVELNKGDALLVWRSKQQTALEVITQFDQNDFYPVHTSQTVNQEYILTISKIKQNS